jgi:hypothetical protein
MKNARMTICFACLMMVTIAGTALAELQDGLVAYYPFNGNAIDQTGNGHDGTVHGALLNTDRFGNPNSAYSFDGGDDYVQIPDAQDLGGMSSLTLAVWVKMNGDGLETEVLNKYDHTSSSRHLGGSYNIGIDGWGPLAVFQYATKDDYVIKISNDPLPIDLWHLIVGVYTGTEGSVYVDGSKVTLSRNDPEPAGPLNSITSDLLIGCGESSGSLYHFFSGKIDDVRIYNRALSADEVQQLYTIPEPATLLLLGLGSVTLRKRRVYEIS